MVWYIIATAILLTLIVLASRRRNRIQPRYTLVWSDEFDGAAGTPPDPTKWTCEIGGGGFGNNELQTYTSRAENVCHDGRGNLVITARKETLTGPDGIARDYTSARLNTLGKHSHQYGRREARIKIPAGQGIWPAFWMMGIDIAEISWAGCGEIDVMEVVKDASINHGTVHGPGYSGADGIGGAYKLLPDGQKLSDDFHVYAVDWEPGAIHFSVDGNHFFSVRMADLKGKKWVYDHPFFILLNVAVGGNWPGNPDETTVFPQTMLVDYVRVYRLNEVTANDGPHATNDGEPDVDALANGSDPVGYDVGAKISGGKATGYGYPGDPTGGGAIGYKGQKLRTTQDFFSGRSRYVSVALNPDLINKLWPRRDHDFANAPMMFSPAIDQRYAKELAEMELKHVPLVAMDIGPGVVRQQMDVYVETKEEAFSLPEAPTVNADILVRRKS